jgi:lysophospholipase L1-like esterase
MLEEETESAMRSRGFGPVLLAIFVAVGLMAPANGRRSDSYFKWLSRPLVTSESGSFRGAEAVVAEPVRFPTACGPDPTTAQILSRAVELFRTGIASRLVVAGGPELRAECRGRLRASGIAVLASGDQRRVFIDSSASEDNEQVARVDDVLAALGVRRLLIVTSALHSGRARADFAARGYTVLSAPVPLAEELAVPVMCQFAGCREYVRWVLEEGAPHTPFELSAPPVSRFLIARPPQWHLAHPDGPLILYGTSYVHGWKLPPVAEVAVVNRGHPGATTSQLLSGFVGDVVAEKPRAVVLQGFDNDLFGVSHQDSGLALERVRQNVAAMVRLAIEDGIEPVLATEVTMERSEGPLQDAKRAFARVRRHPPFEERMKDFVLRGNAWLREFAAQEDLLLLDLQAAVCDVHQNRRPEFAAADGMHLSPAGYDALTRYAAPSLARHLKGRREAHTES